MAKEAFNPNDTTTFIRNALEKERKSKADFTSELKQAARLHARARGCLNLVFRDCYAGRTLDVDPLKDMVSDIHHAMAESPNSLLLVTNLQIPQEHDACHSFNTAVLAMHLGQHLGVNRGELMALGLGGILHDLGKTRIPPLMLVKTAKLTDEERAVVRKHADDGYAALQATGQLTSNVLDIVRYHHERTDGNGYPLGLEGASVPELARMVALVDAYDSLTGGYGYRQPMTPTAALQLLHNDSGEEYGSELVEELIRCLGIYPIGSLVTLNSGAYVMVIASNPSERLKPKVLQVCDEEGKFEKPRPLFDLSRYSEEEISSQWGINELADPIDLDIDLPQIVVEETLH